MEPISFSIPMALAPSIVAISTTFSADMDSGSLVAHFCSRAVFFISSIMSLALLEAAPSTPREQVTPAFKSFGIGATPDDRYMLEHTLWEILRSYFLAFSISSSVRCTQCTISTLGPQIPMSIMASISHRPWMPLAASLSNSVSEICMVMPDLYSLVTFQSI